MVWKKVTTRKDGVKHLSGRVVSGTDANKPVLILFEDAVDINNIADQAICVCNSSFIDSASSDRKTRHPSKVVSFPGYFDLHYSESHYN